MPPRVESPTAAESGLPRRSVAHVLACASTVLKRARLPEWIWRIIVGMNFPENAGISPVIVGTIGDRVLFEFYSVRTPAHTSWMPLFRLPVYDWASPYGVLSMGMDRRGQDRRTARRC